MKTLSLHLFEITSNSVFYGANEVEITVKDSLKENIYSFEVKDNGSGIREENIEKVTDAFFTSRSSRKVGLGLALTKMKAEQCGGGKSMVTSLTVVCLKENKLSPPFEVYVNNVLAVSKLRVRAASCLDADLTALAVTKYLNLLCKLIGKIYLSTVIYLKCLSDKILALVKRKHYEGVVAPRGHHCLNSDKGCLRAKGVLELRGIPFGVVQIIKLGYLIVLFNEGKPLASLLY